MTLIGPPPKWSSNEFSPDFDPLGHMQSLLPDRVLGTVEAQAVAERQALLLLALHGVAKPPVPHWVMTSFPGVDIEWLHDWPVEGMTFRSGDSWRIVIRAADTHERQRFSLAHELKHIIDDPAIDFLFGHLPLDHRDGEAERICNHFAACLLMPGPWIRRDWAADRRQIDELARRYHVSEEAMTKRLKELRLLPEVA